MTDTGGSSGPVVFRPRRGRVVPLVMATIALVVTAGVALSMRGAGWSGGDQLALFGLGAGLAAFLGRYASIRAVGANPVAMGVWATIIMVATAVSMATAMLGFLFTIPVIGHVEVRFPDGAPWVSLELTDTDELAVMAIQRADGDDAKVEARRLAELVAERRTTR